MTHAVGIRTYQIFITRKKIHDFVQLDDSELKTSFGEFVEKFILDRSVSTNHQEHEKSWGIIEKKQGTGGNSRGLISYGRYGYAASLRDANTGVENYKRKRSDAETLNLYYQFWLPDDEKFALAAFSSFSGRSCISLIFEQMKSAFESVNPDFLLKFHRLMPSGTSEKLYAGKPVKSLTLVTRRPPRDLADALFRGRTQKVGQMTLKISSSRNGNLGILSDLIDGLPSDSSNVILYEGIEFEQATASIKIGDEVRPVGVFGAHSDVGVIDVTESVIKDEEGVPTFESLEAEANKILKVIYETLNGQEK
ncbi:MAG: hypothetical protein HEQ34_03175 [Sphingorhabdus sp.]|uniref:hypothetical protein n=1 Tax=Sphingorhabdus sp. TaxID=1902408 RepID=UPI0025F5E01E|nr:hypothetical protein [Sphingorhabdus sp.]MCO4090939.1 hypothetical protein [Sphingorhabdus sp.]